MNYVQEDAWRVYAERAVAHAAELPSLPRVLRGDNADHQRDRARQRKVQALDYNRGKFVSVSQLWLVGRCIIVSINNINIYKYILLYN